MGNTTRSGLHTHDSTPAAWGALGRRGDPRAKATALEMMHAGPEPDHKPFGSTNHHKIQALNNAVVYGDYELALSWHKVMRKHGLAEGGPLYGPAGNFGYGAALLACALRDGRDDIVQMEREALAWYRDYAVEIAVPRPDSIRALLPDGRTDTDNRRTVQGGAGDSHVFMGGSRAAFGGIGWYYEGQATNLYQWLADAPVMVLSPRLADYQPSVGVNGCWDSWAWVTAILLGAIPAKVSAQPQALFEAFRSVDLGDRLGVGKAGRIKCRWRTEVVRFRDGSAIWTTDRVTASPKPPASYIEYIAQADRLDIAIPDGYRNTGCEGRGKIQFDDRNVWAEAVRPGDPVMRTTVRPRSAIVSHRVYPARATGWQDGRLHPKPAPVPPPGHGPEAPKPGRGKSDWVRYRYYVLGAALIGGAILLARGC